MQRLVEGLLERAPIPDKYKPAINPDSLLGFIDTLTTYHPAMVTITFPAFIKRLGDSTPEIEQVSVNHQICYRSETSQGRSIVYEEPIHTERASRYTTNFGPGIVRAREEYEALIARYNLQALLTALDRRDRIKEMISVQIQIMNGDLIMNEDELLELKRQAILDNISHWEFPS